MPSVQCDKGGCSREAIGELVWAWNGLYERCNRRLVCDEHLAEEFTLLQEIFVAHNNSMATLETRMSPM